MNRSTAGDPEGAVLDLLVAFIAVNRWTLEAAFKLRDSLRSAGLADVQAVSGMTDSEVGERLSAAGYSRGQYMSTLLGSRWRQAALVLRESNGRWLLTLEQSAEPGRERELLTLPGVGPQVLDNYRILREE